MSLSINNSGLYTTNQLRGSQTDISLSLARLAAGRRITKAADDAAGLNIADNLNSEARGLGQAMRNANDTAAIIQVADGALGQSADLIANIRVKALAAANASQSAGSRQALQADISKSLAQIETISHTSYNGQQLLTGNFNKNFQIGNNPADSLNINIASAAPNKLGSPETGRLTDINVTTASGAQAALSITDEAQRQVNASRANLGARQNQLTAAVKNMAATEVNTMASESTIRDLDFASETMNLSQMNNLRKARIFAAVQGNVSQKNVINLLQKQL
ncbi:MAG TPA: flagellin [Desulfobacterales bacterium]|nr:flagellin [Desulfobacterales bacterium]